jgi:hypothetical protein
VQSNPKHLPLDNYVRKIDLHVLGINLKAFFKNRWFSTCNMPVEQGVSKPLHPNIIIIQRVVNRVFFNCNSNCVTSNIRQVRLLVAIGNAKLCFLHGSQSCEFICHDTEAIKQRGGVNFNASNQFHLHSP